MKSTKGSLVALAALVALGGSGCPSNHHVSEWGALGRPDLMLYAEKPDMDAHLAEVAEDGDLRGMDLDRELVAEDGGTRYVARSYVGPGLLGRTRRAVRVVTPDGIVLALGPRPSNDSYGHEPVELVVAITPEDGGATAFHSLTDLTGGGVPDVLVRGDDRRYAVFALHPRAAVRLDVDLEVPPTEIADDAGHLGLRGRVTVDPKDDLHPDLVDLATFDRGRFTNRSPAAKGFHARLRDERSNAPPASDAANRSARALELAWHAILAGDDRKAALKALAEAKPHDDLAASFDAYRIRIEKIDR